MARLMNWAAWLSVAFALNIVVSAEGLAASVNASTCNSTDVQTAINMAQGGDTVVVPAGSCVWTTGVTVTKAITLTGSGSVTITCGSDATDLITLVESTTGHIEVTNLTFANGSCSTSSFGKHFFRIAYTPGGQAV